MDQNTLTPQVCSVCEGTGKIYNNVCSNCGGSGYLASDANGRLYLVKKENDSLVVIGPKDKQSQTENSPNPSPNPIDNNFIKIVGNVLFALIFLALVYIDFVFLHSNTYLNIAIIILVFCCVIFNVITLPDKKVDSVRASALGENQVQDLHWAIEQIKKLQTN